MKKLTPKQALEVVCALVSDDFCLDLESKYYGNKFSTDIEMECAKKIIDIYRVSHTYTSSCKHKNWEEHTQKLYEIYKKRGLI